MDVSKLGAGEYGLQHLQNQFHGIIHNAMNVRKGLKERVYHSPEERIGAAVECMKYVLEECNRK